MYKIRKKNQYKPYEIPYSVQITKNHSSLQFIGPCGHSSISRKKIDKKGYLLFNIDKKNFSFRTITFGRSLPQKSILVPPLPSKRLLEAMKDKEERYGIDVFEKKNWIGNDCGGTGVNRKAAISSVCDYGQIFSKKKNKATTIGSNDCGSYNKSSLKNFNSLEGKFQWTNQLLKNKINGVANGYSAFLQLIGLGYRFTIQGDKNNLVPHSIKKIQTLDKFNKSPYSQSLKKPILTIAAGFSHKIRYLFPTDILVFVAKFPKNKICIFGIDKEDVKNCASQIKQIHPPTRYKGKGIRINNEVPILHTGKKNK